MRFLVTGGTGFIGSTLVRKLLSLGHEVLITGREGEQPTDAICIGYDFHKLNWKAIGELDAIFHQAAITNTVYTDINEIMWVNLSCAQQMFEQAVDFGVQRFIYASSCAVYGSVPLPFREDGPKNPLNAYGYSKLYFDNFAMKFAEKHKISIVGLRYSNVYGRGENHKGTSACMVSQIIKTIKENKNPKLFKWGEQARDFVFIDDVVEANLLGLTAETGIYNVASGVSTTFNDVLKILNKIMGTKAEAEYIDNPYEKVYQNNTSCDLSLSRDRLKYNPSVLLEEGCYKLISPSSDVDVD